MLDPNYVSFLPELFSPSAPQKRAIPFEQTGAFIRVWTTYIADHLKSNIQSLNEEGQRVRTEIASSRQWREHARLQEIGEIINYAIRVHQRAASLLPARQPSTDQNSYLMINPDSLFWHAVSRDTSPVAAALKIEKSIGELDQRKQAQRHMQTPSDVQLTRRPDLRAIQIVREMANVERELIRESLPALRRPLIVVQQYGSPFAGRQLVHTYEC